MGTLELDVEPAPVEVAGRADAVLVTSDKLLLRDRWMRGRIVTPDAWLALG